MAAECVIESVCVAREDLDGACLPLDFETFRRVRRLLF